jgi:hypothetical protein
MKFVVERNFARQLVPVQAKNSAALCTCCEDVGWTVEGRGKPDREAGKHQKEAFISLSAVSCGENCWRIQNLVWRPHEQFAETLVPRSEADDDEDGSHPGFVATVQHQQS